MPFIGLKPPNAIGADLPNAFHRDLVCRGECPDGKATLPH